MKKMFLMAIATILTLASCGNSNKQKASQMLAEIESLYEKGSYQESLDSIRSLRKTFPEAREERLKALKIWQNASLKIAQADIARTDSALQAVTCMQQQAATIKERNLLRVKKDSLQARFEALCMTVRAIHKRQQEQ